MKRFKTVVILLGVLAAVCIATVIVTHVEEKKEQIKTTDAVIIAVSPDTVQSLSWEYGSTSLALQKEGSWQWEEDAAFPVDEETVAALLTDFEQFGASFVIEDVEDYGQYGLNDPTCTIRLTAGSEKYEILLGAYSTMDSQRYVSIGDGNVYLVQNDPYDDFELVLSDLILHDTTPSFDQVTQISFSGSENRTIVCEEDSIHTYCPDDVYFTQVGEETVPLDSDRVKNYYNGISRLSLTDYVSYNVTEEELAAWGLDTPELTVNVDYTVTDTDQETGTTETFTLHVGRNQAELTAKQEAEAAAAEAEAAGEEPKTDPASLSVTAYVRVGDSRIVYQISDSTYSSLTAAAYNDLRHAEILTADFEQILQIDLSLEGEDYTITSELPEDAEDNTERTYFLNGEEIKITNLRSKINALSVSSFTEEEPSGKEELALTFFLNNENYPQVRVELYRVDGSSCLAVLDGQTLGLVSRTSVVDLIEAVNSLILG